MIRTVLFLQRKDDKDLLSAHPIPSDSCAGFKDSSLKHEELTGSSINTS